MKPDQAKIFADNLAVLRRRYPMLAQAVETFPERREVCAFRARDGSLGHGLRRDGKIVPLTDPVAPTARLQKQLDDCATPLADLTRPVLIVGLCPGTEVLGIFDQAEQDPQPHCPQPIWVCVDALPCFYGFLCNWDARAVLAAPRVTWFLKEQMPARIDFLRQNPAYPHMFTLISGAPENSLNQILPPLAQLSEERHRETRCLIEQNARHYAAISDSDLARVIAGDPAAGRRPRLMTPTCAWSTYVQHSARDICAAFEQMGWETRLLRMEAMLTPYFLAHQINAFKPDVFLFIDHLRCEAEELYPRGMMFVTWVQDEMDNIFNAAAGKKISDYAAAGRRDLVVGYVDRLAGEFAYPRDRLTRLHIPANPAIFKPVRLDAQQRRRFTCDLAFMSNVSLCSEEMLTRHIVPRAQAFGLPRDTLADIHDRLLAEYRAGRFYNDRRAFQNFLMQFPAYCQLHQTAGRPDQATDAGRQELFRLLYWRLNDTICRHTVLEWAVELGLRLHLYGQGWERHPRFKDYARGMLRHGAELNAAYQGAGCNLHVNITTGMHQRIWEIISAGARPLMRIFAQANAIGEPAPARMRALARQLLQNSTAGLAAALEQAIAEDTSGAMGDWVFRIVMHAAQSGEVVPAGTAPDPADLTRQTLNQIEAAILCRPEWLVPDWEQCHFHDRATFAQRVSRLRASDPLSGG